ncbi:uncharacterized protein BP01DRAFT_305912 [Aspergillus saccharolyticus JOP 1030-1]|uniref:Trafficking protein particle complex subunit 12 n=1 Tax=Aspergillus saccharolyticus JOP 1030-1 TaxID=1450539 RepID=A0A318ZMG5_9EURO|nr:hypothetical protein BP01DRAFT_305912 [Aspergillus saccharolyticus JOP 1030-1]PYH41378.1 hypothetical protein BP01DRAFT_305912 [Aspergillus saccharolyticus JOP 1030-1]
MEATVSRHSRNASRSSRPRSTTKGPLDQVDDPLGTETVNISSPLRTTALPELFGTSFENLDPLAPDDLPPTVEKDLSFLLRYEVYHSLSQLDIPHALRSEFIVPASSESLPTTLQKLEQLLAEGHFLLAAHLSGTILSSSLLKPTDIRRIFALFYTRLACLQLSGNTIIAAQESKALEDLTSAFYYVEPLPDKSDKGQTYPRHIVPWPLRALAVRLQSIGFGDSRRGIGGLYEIGLEARREILRTDISPAERQLWRERLADLGVRNVNALIEMGDLNAAKQALDSMRMSGMPNDLRTSSKVLLLVLIGDLDSARRLCSEGTETEQGFFNALLSMAEGQYSAAADEWRSLLERERQRPDEAVIQQNLAVCLLYTGHLNEAREVLESLIQKQHSFPSLVYNLSTIYELCSEKAGKLKAELVETVARQPARGDLNLDRPSADFKI